MKTWKDVVSENKEEVIEPVEEKMHQKDDLLGGITFEELITTIQSNESVVNEKVVKKVYKEILKANLDDAEYELKQNMKEIIKLAS